MALLLLNEPVGFWQFVGSIIAFIGMAITVTRGDLLALLRLDLNVGDLFVVESRSGAVAAVAAPFPDPAHQTGRAVLASGFRTRVNELSPTARWCENGLSGLIRASHEDMQPDSGAGR